VTQRLLQEEDHVLGEVEGAEIEHFQLTLAELQDRQLPDHCPSYYYDDLSHSVLIPCPLGRKI
jgi:hypothetical protein